MFCCILFQLRFGIDFVDGFGGALGGIPMRHGVTPPAHSAPVWLGARVSGDACDWGRFYDQCCSFGSFLGCLATLSGIYFASFRGAWRSNWLPFL